MSGVPAVVAVVAYSLVAAGFAPYSWPMRLSTALPIVAACLVALGRGWGRGRRDVPVDDRGRASTTGLAVWLALIAAAGAVQLTNYFSSPRSAYPTLSSLAELVFDSHAIRAAAFASWLWFAKWFLDR